MSGNPPANIRPVITTAHTSNLPGSANSHLLSRLRALDYDLQVGDEIPPGVELPIKSMGLYNSLR